MSRRVITATDVRRLAADGRTVLEMADGDVVTPLAVDDAHERGIQIRSVSESEGATARVDDVAADRPQTPGVRHVVARGVELEPFPFPGPEAAMDVRLRDVVTDADGAPMAAGLMSLHRGSFPWRLDYDEVEYVIEGELHIGTQHGAIVGLPGDVIYIPKGTSISFGTPSWAKFLYVTYPAQWGEA
jgi:ethanolamine utilization protein EutQ